MNATNTLSGTSWLEIDIAGETTVSNSLFFNSLTSVRSTAKKPEIRYSTSAGFRVERATHVLYIRNPETKRSARTTLGKFLLEKRAKAISEGMKLLTIDEINETIRSSRSRV